MSAAQPTEGSQPRIALRRDIYVGESSADARTVLQQALSKGYRGIPAEALIAGSIDEVAEQLHALGELGYTDVIVRHLTNDQPKVLGSVERLKEVRAVLGQPLRGSRRGPGVCPTSTLKNWGE